MLDTHCHLDASEFANDRTAVVDAARAAGVARVLVPAVSVAGCAGVDECLAAYPDMCRGAYGIHPLYVDGVGGDDLARLEMRLSAGTAIAVGEIGLDCYVDGIDPERQLALFRAQLALARRFDLPVILHVRRAVDAVLHELRRTPVCGGIAHAFNGSQQQAELFIRLGFKLGFGGAMTYDGSRRIRALAAALPLDALVLETDAPDMAPAWLHRGRNSPAELPRIAETLAGIRGVPLAEIVERTSTAARAVLPGL